MRKEPIVGLLKITGFILIVMLSWGCASSRYAKKGLKYEQAGLWEMAAEAYMNSLSARNDNVDAIIGLKRSGQRVMDDRSRNIVKAYENEDIKQVVYLYLDALKFKNSASSYKVELSLSKMATDCFNDAKPRYIEKLYSEAARLLEEEKFRQAEELFAEITLLQPNYGDVGDKLMVAKLEPLYREGKRLLEAGKYRRAYANFEKILLENETYKDSRELRTQALLKAMITIKVDDFKPKSGANPQVVEIVRAVLISTITRHNNPFIKILDGSLTERFIEEQRQSLHSANELEIGRLLAAKAILGGEVSIPLFSTGTLNKLQKKGYVKEVIKEKNPKMDGAPVGNSDQTSNEEKNIVTYKKVYYYVYSQRNEAVLTLKFNLTSTETGAILLTDLVRSRYVDEIEFARFDGPAANLVPGFWEKIDAASPNDVVFDNPRDVRELQSLLKARAEITPVDVLLTRAIDDAARQAAMLINSYNPEK